MGSSFGFFATALVTATTLYLFDVLRRRPSYFGEEKDETPLETMARRNKLMHSKESIEAGRNFKANKSDVFIVTYPKCGTTWMQQICNSLRTGGRMDFGEICEVVPWDIVAKDCGQDLESKQIAEPRLFKSHEPYSTIAKGAKYIYVARNPLDALISFHKFLPAYAGIESGAITIEEFVEAIFAHASQAGLIWHHFLEWYHVRNAPNVLWIFFEDLKKDLPSQVEQIARFLEVECDHKLMDVVVRQASYQFMRENANKFDDHFVFDKVKLQMGLPSDAKFSVGKVRQGGGKVGDGGREIPPAIRGILQKRWEEIITPVTGLETYEDLRNTISVNSIKESPMLRPEESRPESRSEAESRPESR